MVKCDGFENRFRFTGARVRVSPPPPCAGWVKAFIKKMKILVISDLHLTTRFDEKKCEFLEKLIKIVIPRLKDFRGIPDSNIDQNGNLNIGFPEQIIFPEIDFDKIDKIRGLQVTVVTNAKNKEKGKKLFEMLGIPFTK